MTAAISKPLAAWLEDSGSFMERLKQAGFPGEVEVLNEVYEYPQEEEAFLLRVPPRRYIFSREVLIHHRGEALLFARTVCPLEALKGKGRVLKSLGKRSLGSVLFAFPDLWRSPFEFQSVLLPAYSAKPLWGRRSLFQFQGKSLLLSEVFLPDKRVTGTFYEHT